MGTIEQSIALDVLIGIAEQINELKMADRLSEEEAERFQTEMESMPDDMDMLNARIEEEIVRKGTRSNISFFAFTATPKEKTIELFCERRTGVKEPFDLY